MPKDRKIILGLNESMLVGKKKKDLLQNLAEAGSFLLLAGSLESRNYHNRTQRTEK